MATRRGISSRGGEGVERRGDLAGEARRCVRAMLVNAIRPRGGWPHAGGCQRPYVVSHDFHTGKELWRLKAGGDNPIPTPFTAHGYIYDANGHGAEAPV